MVLIRSDRDDDAILLAVKGDFKINRSCRCFAFVELFVKF